MKKSPLKIWKITFGNICDMDVTRIHQFARQQQLLQNLQQLLLPALKEYEFAAGYCVEYYDDPAKYFDFWL